MKSPISFYTDLSKQKEFLDRLEEILKTPNDLESCQLTMMVSNQIALSLTPSDKKAKNVYFYFTENREEYSESKVIKALGFNNENTKKLINLFNDFSISNQAETSFFVSQFFAENFSHNLIKKSNNRFITPMLYFNPGNNPNLFLIAEEKLKRFYTPIFKESLKVLIKDVVPGLDSSSSYIKFSSYGYRESKSFEEAKLNMTDTKEQIIAEVYKNLETGDSYLHTVYKIIDEQTIGEDSVPFMKELLGDEIYNQRTKTKKMHK